MPLLEQVPHSHKTAAEINRQAKQLLTSLHGKRPQPDVFSGLLQDLQRYLPQGPGMTPNPFLPEEEKASCRELCGILPRLAEHFPESSKECLRLLIFLALYSEGAGNNEEIL